MVSYLASLERLGVAISMGRAKEVATRLEPPWDVRLAFQMAGKGISQTSNDGVCIESIGRLPRMKGSTWARMTMTDQEKV